MTDCGVSMRRISAACQCHNVCFCAAASVDAQQHPTGLVRHNDGVVAAERVSGIAWYDGYAQACVEAVDGLRGTSCAFQQCLFQQFPEVLLCDVDARVLEGLGVHVAALPLLE